MYLHTETLRDTYVLTVYTLRVICRDLAPSEGGKYVGFGSGPVEAQKRDDDLMASLSSV